MQHNAEFQRGKFILYSYTYFFCTFCFFCWVDGNAKRGIGWHNLWRNGLVYYSKHCMSEFPKTAICYAKHYTKRVESFRGKTSRKAGFFIGKKYIFFLFFSLFFPLFHPFINPPKVKEVWLYTSDITEKEVFGSWHLYRYRYKY